MKKYSFVIPTYNCKEIVFNSLEAIHLLERSKYYDFEVILVDDGSTDGTKEYFEKKDYPFTYRYIHLERRPNSSRARARNYGLKAAQGRYVIFIDADIIVRPDYLFEIDRYLSQVPYSVVVGLRLMLKKTVSPAMIRGAGVFSRYEMKHCDSSLFEFRHIAFEELSFNFSRFKYPFLYAQTCNIVYPRKALIEVGGFDESMIAWGVEDIEMAYRVFKLGLPFLLNTRMSVLHQFHGYNESQEEQILGVKINTDIFCRKHPNALPISNERTHDLFMSLATRYYYLEDLFPQSSPVTIIKHLDSADLKDIKAKILQAETQEYTKLVVYDYLEASDLDIWIQQLGEKNNMPLYYPMSIYKKYLSDLTCKNNIKKIA